MISILSIVMNLTWWDLVDKILRFTIIFFKKKAQSCLNYLLNLKDLNPQFVLQPDLRSSPYCTIYIKRSILLYLLNFGTKFFIVWLVIYNTTVIKMWSNEIFADGYKSLFWKNMWKPLNDSRSLICFWDVYINMLTKI